MSRVAARSIAKTALLPGIIPRVKDVVSSGFATLAYLMALLYSSVQLLPPDHPFANPSNYGRFGVRDVISAAADNLVLSRKNTDQILIFFAILFGLILLVCQALLFVFMILTETAWAQSTALPGLFVTQYPEKDVAFSLLDQVFGIPGFFGSEFDPAEMGGAPSPFQNALHQMFAFYSFVMLAIAGIIFVYYLIGAALESAQTGVPFGQRFDSVWAPLRLVVALGLLVPLGYGLNSAQYITLFAAKYGSGLASNGWTIFMDTIVKETNEDRATPIGYLPNAETILLYRGRNGFQDVTIEVTEDTAYRRALLAIPNIPDSTDITRFGLVVATCYEAYKTMYDMDIKAYLVNGNESIAISASYQEALEFFDNGDIYIRYGHKNEDLYPKEKSGIKPFCGELRVPIQDISTTGEDGAGDLSPAGLVQEAYYNFARFVTVPMPNLTMFGFSLQSDLAGYLVHLSLSESDETLDPVGKCDDFGGGMFAPDFDINSTTPCEELPDPDINLLNNLVVNDEVILATNYAEAFETALETADTSMRDDVMERGWGGAAIWYNTIARLNGGLTSVTQNLPTPSQMPFLMEEAADMKSRAEQQTQPGDMYNPVIRNEQGEERKIFDEDIEKQQIAELLYRADGLYSRTYTEQESKSNRGFFTSLINWLLGTEGLFTIRENVQVHPLAQLSSLGRSMVDASLRNLAFSATAGISGGVIGLFDQNFGDALKSASGFFAAFASIPLAAGFVLYYIVPFMPFMYFFFAVVSWVKTIFEAMVGVPLWALAHLRVQGNGLPGQAAASGYFLIFEIFLRPILILFGLLAASIIFFTEVYLLHITYDLVVENIAGADPSCASISGVESVSTNCQDGGAGFSGMVDNVRSSVDAFFYTIMYTIIIYIMATSTFKLIDRIPGEIIRWMGGATSTFTENAGDPMENLTRNAAISGSVAGQQLTGAVPQLFGAGGQGAGRGLGQGGLNTANTFGMMR